MSYSINTLVSSDKVVVSYEKRMSICLLANGFSFSVTSLRNELLTLGEVQMDTKASIPELVNNIKAAFSEAHIQPYGLKECELIVMANQFVWVPQPLFEPANERQYLEAACSLAPASLVQSSFNSEIDAYVVFAADSTVVSAFKVALPGIKIRCQHDKMVNSSLVEFSDQRAVLAMHIRDTQTDYAVLNNRKLAITNTFESCNFDESLYHALNLAQQFHLEESNPAVAVCGCVNRQDFTRLQSFFPQVSLYVGRPLTLCHEDMCRQPLYRHALILS